MKQACRLLESDWGIHHSSVGPIRYAYDGDVICELAFLQTALCTRGVTKPHRGIEESLDDYFAGDPRGVQTWPVDFRGTKFQVEVWKSLREIPPGQTLTYGEMARLLGHPKAARAVGMAMRANRIPLFIPCHRIIAAGGRIGGFSPGIALKRHLLTIEGAWGNPQQTELDFGKIAQDLSPHV